MAMGVKEIRELSGLTQAKFAEKYHIPKRTIENWEVSESSPEHREAPEYIRELLERVVREDFERKSK